jgi:hypothetical protein
MAKSKYSIQDAYAAQQAAGGGQDDSQSTGADQDSNPDQPLTIQPSDVAQLEQLKQQGDQSGDYSALGKAFAQILDASEQGEGGGASQGGQ